MTDMNTGAAAAPEAQPEKAPAKPTRVPKRIAKTILNALKGGVVPRIGLPYIAVGRNAEIDALLDDVAVIEEGGASFRFIVGKYGSGKSFLLQTIRSHVMDRGFVVADADLSPERRLHGTKGQGLATYRELMQNLATKTMPEGGALALILERWSDALRLEVAESGLSPAAPGFAEALERRVLAHVTTLDDVVHGFEFGRVLSRYALATAGALDEPEAQKSLVLKWFRGEFATKAEAKAALGVNLVATDDNWYDFLKVFALFLKRAGYKGLLVLIDELVNLYKIPNTVSRQYNYEKILTMYNDTLQGKARYIGIVMSGTPQCVEDRRRGIFSYEALRSRLESGRFVREGRRDLMSPVIHLAPLSVEELLVLIEKLAAMHRDLYATNRTIDETTLAAFLSAEYGRVGAETHITPREIIRDFIEFLNILAQNPDVEPQALIESDAFRAAIGPSNAGKPDDSDDFVEFTL